LDMFAALGVRQTEYPHTFFPAYGVLNTVGGLSTVGQWRILHFDVSRFCSRVRTSFSQLLTFSVLATGHLTSPTPSC
jgi:hypothetical protein